LALSLREVVNALRQDWEIDVVTAAENATSLPERSLSFLHRPLRTLRLEKLEQPLTRPDPYWPWIWLALRVAERIVNERQPSVGLIFMTPFSTGFVGTLLKARTGLPIVFNLNDSPTCSDMNPTFPSRLHYTLSTWMEDTYVRTVDRTEIVAVHGRVSHSDVHRITRDADLLFLTLPDRLDGSAGGRISLKTYEYLTTDRPILAAVPPVENHDFLHAKPGTYLTAPRDMNAMRDVIEEQVAAHFGGHAPSFDRSSLQFSFSSTTRAAALSTLLHEVARPAECLAPTLS
jgi:hypothetical protein